MTSLPHEAATFVALLTPAGRGAIATIAVVGSRACEVVNRRFTAFSGCPLHADESGKIAVGHFRGMTSTEELVVGLPQAERVEVHCHGGSAAAEAVISALVAEGCTRIAWQALAGERQADAIQAAAQVALSAARTERTAVILLAQYQGALARAIESIQRQVQTGQRNAAIAEIDALLAHGELGRHLTEPWQVVLAGRPNVGKSSLINALVGYQRSIVFDQPGTTRDVVTATTAIAGWPLELADTAGLRESGDAIEQAGVARAQRQIEQADLALLVFESPAPWSAEDEWLVAQMPGKQRRLILYNKCDLAMPADDGRPAGLGISAVSNLGLDLLVATIARQLVPNPPAPSAGVPFTAQQIEWLQALRQTLVS
jgi:tRNA modification GTPase